MKRSPIKSVGAHLLALLLWSLWGASPVEAEEAAAASALASWEAAYEEANEQALRGRWGRARRELEQALALAEALPACNAQLPQTLRAYTAVFNGLNKRGTILKLYRQVDQRLVERVGADTLCRLPLLQGYIEQLKLYRRNRDVAETIELAYDIARTADPDAQSAQIESVALAYAMAARQAQRRGDEAVASAIWDEVHRRFPEWSGLGDCATGKSCVPGCDGEIAYAAYLSPRKLSPYPERARVNRANGSVWLRLFLDAEGDVTRVLIEKNTNPGLGFAESALATVEQQRFRAATCDGEPMASQYISVHDFTIH